MKTDPVPAGPARAFPPEEYSARISKLLSKLGKLGVDGALITDPVTRLYYTGFTSTAGTLLVDAAQGPVFLVDFRYIFMARKAMPFAKCVLTDAKHPKLLEQFTAKWFSCGYEARMSVESFERVKGRLSHIADWVQMDKAIAEQRSVKSRREQQAIRRSVAANDAMFAWAVPQLHPGMTEWEARAVFRRGADLFGQGESFDTIVCAGANGAECHHVPDLTPISARGPLLMDFGIRLDHYCSDMTRNLHFGKPSPLYRKVYDIVLEANRRAVAGLRPGMTGMEVDAIARDFIAKKGYGDAFGHSLGHSVGMEIHEGPNFSAAEARVIKPGMVVTVEPGIYLPGKFGVRIEDVVLVTRTGCECLSTSPRAIL